MSKIRRALNIRLWSERIGQNLGLVVAIAAVAIAVWSAKVQRDAMQLDERPYLKVSFESIEPTKRSQIAKEGISQWSGYDAKVEIQVSGKTPAFKVAARGKCARVDLLKRQGTDNGLTWRLWPFLFDEKQTVSCHVEQDLPDGNLPPNVPFDLAVDYDDIFKRRHRTTFCEVIITMRGEGVPRHDAIGTVECEHFKFVMN
jgi:hypothetical protein